MYCYRVVTLDFVTQETSPPSAFSCALTSPGPVKNLRALSYNTSGARDQLYPAVTLDWLDASNETGYRISRSESSSGPCTTRFNARANRSMFTDYTGSAITAHLKGNTTYWYRVESLDGLGNVSGTQVVSVKTVSGTFQPVVSGTPSN